MKPVYFHGVPGGMAEVGLTGVAQSALSPESGARPDSHLIAFSLGAHRALEYGARHGAARIDLISPAAPLILGDFLRHMAGAPVFKSAALGRLSAITKAQAAFVRVAPGLFRHIMLAAATPADRVLFQTPANRAIFTQILRESLIEHRATYEASITAYIKDWSALLPRVTAPVTLWHGSADTWAPPEMSIALSQHLPNATLNALPEHGHYSTLAAVLPRLVN